MKKHLFTIFLAMAASAVTAQTLTSPDGMLKTEFSLDAQGRPTVGDQIHDSDGV